MIVLKYKLDDIYMSKGEFWNVRFQLLKYGIGKLSKFQLKIPNGTHYR